MAARGGSVLLVGLTQTPQALKLSDVVLQEIDIRTTVAHVCDTDLPAALELLAERPLAPCWSTGSSRWRTWCRTASTPLRPGPCTARCWWSHAVAEVAVLGAGRMGSAMARRVAGAGHGLTVWNRTEAAARALSASVPGARVAGTAAEAVRGCDVVLSVLADGAATCAVLLDTDVVSALPRGGVVCDLATSGVAAAGALGAGLAEAGVPFVDAPVSGSVPAVEAGTLLVMAGGDPAAIAAAEPILAAFARRVVRGG
jgi:hypothetical protein